LIWLEAPVAAPDSRQWVFIVFFFVFKAFSHNENMLLPTLFSLSTSQKHGKISEI
jgi:hypothetical protein